MRYSWLLPPPFFLFENVFSAERVSPQHFSGQRTGAVAACSERLLPTQRDCGLILGLVIWQASGLGPCPGCNLDSSIGYGGEEEPWGGAAFVGTGREEVGRGDLACPGHRKGHSPPNSSICCSDSMQGPWPPPAWPPSQDSTGGRRPDPTGGRSLEQPSQPLWLDGPSSTFLPLDIGSSPLLRPPLAPLRDPTVSPGAPTTE